MGTLLDRNRRLLARASDLSPLEGPIRQILADGKAEHLLRGKAADGETFAPLAASTLRRPRSDPHPLAPHGLLSRAITAYRVSFERLTGRLIVTAGWPSLDWIGHHRTGGRNLPRRDP